MPPSPPAPPPSDDAAKQRIARGSLLAGAALFAFKLAVFVHSHSLGILAEAAHSGLDLLAASMTWISIRVAARPADADHPFGHGKFESFSAFLQTGLLMLTALALGVSAWQRWQAGGAGVHVDGWAFAVMLTAMAVDWRRSRLLGRAARQYDSDALAADALNFSTDLATAAAVLIGLACAAAGQHWNVPALLRGDAVAAGVVAVAMLTLGLRLGRRTAGVLLDEAPAGMVAELRASLAGLPGVVSIPSLRMRRAGSRSFVDLRLQLETAVTLEGAQAVRQEIARRIHRRLPAADVLVETEPGEGELPLQQVQAIARRHNLNVHDLSAYDLGEGLEIEFHLELPEATPLAQAHNLVSRLETEMREAVPRVRQILTHIEPESDGIIAAGHVADPGPIARRVIKLAAGVDGVLDCHEIQVRQSGGHLALSCHCSFPDAMPIARVHELATLLEARIKRELPALFRVTIHPEPGSDNRR